MSPIEIFQKRRQGTTLPVLGSLFQDQNQKPVHLKENYEAVLAGEEYIHVADNSVP